MFGLFAKIAILVLVPLIFALARRYLPFSSMGLAAADAPPLSELDSQFELTQWVFGAGMLAIGVVIFFALHRMLLTINLQFAERDGRADFVLLPQNAIWYFLPGFAAVAMSWEVSLRIWSLIGSTRQASLYEYWSNAKAGFNATRVLRILMLVVGVPVGILTGLALPEHDSLRGTDIRHHRYGLSPAAVFRYSDAKSLTVIDGFRTRDGKLIKRAGCVLYFADGRRWSSSDIGDFRASVDPALVTFLHDRTGLPVTHSITEANVH